MSFPPQAAELPEVALTVFLRVMLKVWLYYEPQLVVRVGYGMQREMETAAQHYSKCWPAAEHVAAF